MPSNPLSKGLGRDNVLLGLNLQLNPAEPLFLYQTRMRNSINPVKGPPHQSPSNRERGHGHPAAPAASTGAMLMAALRGDPPPPPVARDGRLASTPSDLGESETSLLGTQPAKQQKAQSKFATLASRGPSHPQQVTRC